MRLATACRALAGLVVVLLIGAGASSCSGASSPSVVVNYAASPVTQRSTPTGIEAKPSAVRLSQGGPTVGVAPTRSATPTADDAEDGILPDDFPVASAAATVAPAPLATVLGGQVPEAQGTFVTSNSRSSRYYYARDDNGWHRIRSDHRIWFANEGDLKKAFPGRVLHAAVASRATRTPTPIPLN
jgi:hypothetical protein